VFLTHLCYISCGIVLVSFWKQTACMVKTFIVFFKVCINFIWCFHLLFLDKCIVKSYVKEWKLLRKKIPLGNLHSPNNLSLVLEQRMKVWKKRKKKASSPTSLRINTWILFHFLYIESAFLHFSLPQLRSISSIFFLPPLYLDI